MAAGRHDNPRRELRHRHRLSRSGAYEIEKVNSRVNYSGGWNNGYSRAPPRIGCVAGEDDGTCESVELNEKEIPPAKKSKFSNENSDVLLNSISCDLNDVCDATNKLQEPERLSKSDVAFRSAESTITGSPTLSRHASLKERMVDDVDVKDVDSMQVDDVGHTNSLDNLKSRWDAADDDDDKTPIHNYSAHSENRSKKVYSADGHSSSACREFSRGDSVGGRSESLPRDDRENDSGTVIKEDYHDSKGGVSEVEPCFEVVKLPRNAIWDSCRSVFDYEMLNKINEGTYGVVYRARDKITGEIVALKKVKLENEGEGFPTTALREIKFLMSFDHPSIVHAKEIVMGDLNSVFVVMEYMEHDLKGVMELMKHQFSISEVKCLMLQLLEGVKFLHDNWIMHRDLKSSNILFNNQGELKICDLGMARQYANPLKPYTAAVVTLWYRAPEILFGATQRSKTLPYSKAVDMWSAGCIMAELLSKQPLFQGRTEVDQTDKIIRVLGTPNDTIWPGFSELPNAKVKFVNQPYNFLRKKFPVTSFTGSPALSDAGFDLLNRMLTYDPVKRITVDEALNHRWFQEVPLAKAKELLPTYPAQK